MKKTTRTFSGKIVDRKTQKGLSQLRLEAWKKKSTRGGPLKTAATNSDGEFTLQIDPSVLKNNTTNLVVKIYREDELIEIIPLDKHLQNNGAVIAVDVPTPALKPEGKINLWHVVGHVKKANGEPVPAVVKAFNKRLNGEQPIGETRTRNGTYIIKYNPAVLDSPCGKSTDIIVRAYTNDVEIATSAVIYNAPKTTTVDLIMGNEVYKGPSEYERLARAIKPCLGAEDPATLTQENVLYLVNKTGVDQNNLILYVLAHRQAKIVETNPPLLYACHRRQLPRALDKLVTIKPTVIASRIQGAIDNNIIDEKWKTGIHDFLEHLGKSAVKSALIIDKDSTKTSLGKVLSLIKVPTESQQELLKLYLENKDNINAFWQNLSKHKTFGRYAAPLRLALKVSTLTQHYEPATNAIMTLSVLKNQDDISTLTRLSTAEWTALTKEIGSAPENIPGKGDEQLKNYATLMEKSVNSAFPTQNIAANISRDDKYQQTELPKFFEASPGFSFEGTNIPSYVNKLNGSINDKTAVIKDLSRLQRLYYLSPTYDRYEVMSALDNAGLGSALQIKQYGKQAFVKTFSSTLGGEAAATAIFNKANQIQATVMNIAMQYQDIASVTPYVLQSNGSSSAPEELEIPNLTTLFGSQSFCSCKHCRSVYSPAAYLVDMLSYLKAQYAIDQQASTSTNTVYKPGVTGLSLLFERRPEIGNIILNCENTNTIIPYIDIVNEVLENAVLTITDAYQTTSTSDELLANPEHVNNVVYDDVLSKGIFPFSQPFSLWNEEASVYLEHLDVPRYKLIDTFQFKGTSNEPSYESKYTVQLKLTENARKIITGERTIDSTLHEHKAFWGVIDEKWRVKLSIVRTFIDKAEISYEQLLQFLQVKYVNPDGSIKVQFAEGAPCDIEQAILAYWDETTQTFSTTIIAVEFFDKAHRFFRLLRTTPWTIMELGKVMSSLKVADIDVAFLEQVAILMRLQQKTEIKILELLSWWSTLNTQYDMNDEEDRSFYALHFLNKTVFDPKEINEGDFVFTLNDDGTELKTTGNKISEYLNEIAAALNITSTELLLLTEKLTAPDGTADDTLTLSNLSQLFRIVSLTNATDLSIGDYLIAVNFVTVDPFSKTTPDQLPEFIKQIEQVKKSAFSFSELNYLLLNNYNSTDGIAPFEDEIIRFLASLQQGLTKIKSEHEVTLSNDGLPVDPTGDLCKQKLSLLIEPENIDYVVAIVEATDGLSPQQKTDAALYLYFLDVDQLIIDFSADGDYKTIEERYGYILKGLIEYLTITQSESFIIQTLSSELSIDLITAELLLTTLVLSSDPASSGEYAIADFLNPDFAYHEWAEEEAFDLTLFGVQQNTYAVLFKSAMFISKFDMNSDEVGWTFTRSADIGWLDLNSISGTPPAVFASWRKMENFFRMRNKFTVGDTSFFDLMDYAADPSTLEALDTGYELEVDSFISTSTTWSAADKNFLIFLRLLSEITAWETDSLYYLASTEAYALGFTDFKDEMTFCHLMECFEMLNKMGASSADAWSWTAIDLTSINSNNIKQTAKAKYSETEWLGVAQPLRDILRERQRDELTAYLIQHRDFEDEYALYSHYLLDVEMSACMKTSRIVLANSSIQLFVQRHLMNLETEILDLDADRWEWMKNYRVWEANRKVFLYPENWIEPELRLMKSPFFTELQNALLQNDVTDDLVESAIKDYLEKLDDVSNIEVCGVYHQKEVSDGVTGDGPPNTLHVFGKTKGVPAEYYYRAYIDDTYWTPWERVNLEVQGDHLIPIVLNSRLYLFWPEFTEKQEDISNIITEGVINNIATAAMEAMYSSNWEPYPTYQEWVDEYGEEFADIMQEAGMTQEAVRNTYINPEGIQEYIDDHYTLGAINFYEIKLAYSEYKNNRWLPKKISNSTLVSETLWRSLDMFYGYTVGDVRDKICFHTSVKTEYLEISCTQKVEVQNTGSLLWMDQGSFKFYYSTKEVFSEDTGFSNSIMEPDGSSVYYNSFKEETYSPLELITADVTSAGNYDGNESAIPVLDLTPGYFRIPIAHQYDEFVSQSDFFYGDDYRNLFVRPYRELDNASTQTGTTWGGVKNNMDHVLTGSAIEVGIFSDTVFTQKEVTGVLTGGNFSYQDVDISDAIVSVRDNGHEKKLVDVSGSEGALKTKAPQAFVVDAQVNQFEFLGDRKYRFVNFYHPYINEFIKAVNWDGVEGVLTRDMQQQLEEYFYDAYLPTENVHTSYPVKEVDFSTDGAMSIYNWELFFHIPLLIAQRLSKNQRFEEAQRWYHFIFNPTDRSTEISPNKFWQFKPFFDLYEAGESGAEDSIYNLLYALSYSGTDSAVLDKKAQVQKQVDAWLESPFDPHAIASLRPIAYMKTVVMKYIDNLVEWGDHLFRQDSMESINEATQFYLLAAQILGKRPELIPVEEADERTYNQLVSEAGALDAFSNALVTLENTYNSEGLYVPPTTDVTEQLPDTLFFCIPNNPKLLSYWDTVEDRLFKIRHCMNIEGVVRQLPLFQPPIDPALLVRARAAGLDIGSVLSDLYAPLSHFRYRAITQKALEFCADVKALGNALLSVFEKRDSEELALLRAGHEQKLLRQMSDIKTLQLDEARQNVSALHTMRKITEARYDYYFKIEKINSTEQLNLDKLEDSRTEQKLAETNEKRAANLYIIPNIGVSLPASISTTFGGSNLGAIANAYAAGHRNKSSEAAYEANKASIQAGHDRRWDDWKLQEKLASRELAHIDKQITAAEIRIALMEKEVSNHETQLENSLEVSDHMTGKFTNKALYDWMSGQLSGVYFQSYQMAYDLAKKAQKCFQYELNSDQTFIEFGYWDSLNKGLLAGEKLHYDLKRMEVAYFDLNKRTYELTKSISLGMLDPLALVQLRETGTCYINLPEAVYDLDYPGQYMRRIKSVQLTLPCVTGPYTSVNCKLTLLDNKWRKDTSGDYPESTDEYDSRFVYNTGGTQSIATSSGQNDSGMFQLNFNDDRYLPFEGAGAISNWRLELPEQMRSFDYNTLSDVIMQINYTAKEGGDILKEAASNALNDALMAMALGSDSAGLSRMFSLKNEFSNEWYRFLNPPADQDGQNARLVIDQPKFPYVFQPFDITVTKVEIILVLNDVSQADTFTITLIPPGTSPLEVTLTKNENLGGQLSTIVELAEASLGEWQVLVDEDSIPESLQVTMGDHRRLNVEVVKNLIFILSYNIEA